MKKLSAIRIESGKQKRNMLSMINILLLSLFILAIQLIASSEVVAKDLRYYWHKSNSNTKEENSKKHQRLHLNRFYFKPNKSYLNDKDSDTVINSVYELDIDDLVYRVKFNIKEHRKLIQLLLDQNVNKIYTNQTAAYENLNNEILS